MKKPPEGISGGFVFGEGKQVLPVGDPCWAWTNDSLIMSKNASIYILFIVNKIRLVLSVFSKQLVNMVTDKSFRFRQVQQVQ